MKVKMRISNKIKKLIVTLLKLSVAYKNKGGKIVEINMKRKGDIPEIRYDIKIVAIIAQTNAEITIVNLLISSITYRSRGREIECMRIAQTPMTIAIVCLSFVHV